MDRGTAVSVDAQTSAHTSDPAPAFARKFPLPTTHAAALDGVLYSCYLFFLFSSNTMQTLLQPTQLLTVSCPRI
jgi:hypothetical protein